MADSRGISRRRALTALGVTGTAVGSYVAGVRTAPLAPDWLAGRDCDPAPLTTGETDWPFPRRDGANTGRAPARAAPAWPVERAWAREWPVGGFFRLAPLTVADGVVLASVAAGSTSGLYAFSLADGTARWRAVAGNDRPQPVAVAGGVAFFRATPREDPPAVQARTLTDGSVLWERPARSVVAVAGGRVVVADSERHEPARLTAYDARTGGRCWRASVGERPDDAVVDGGLLVLLRRTRGAIALDPATGERRWRSERGGNAGASAGGRLLASRFPGELRALSLTDGGEEWAATSDHYAPTRRTDEGFEVARPNFELGALADDAVVYTLDVISDFPSRVQARDPASGDLLWDYGPTPDRTRNARYSRPVRVGDEVLVNERAPEGGLSVVRLDAATGERRARLQFDTSHLLSPPVVADGTLLVATGEGIVAYT